MSETVVKFEHVSMEFPGVLANDDVSLEIKKGEVFALVGENGAGKSTLMNILYGINTPTNGEVYVKGRRIEHFSPKAAIERGVGMVHQHFMLVPSFTVAQNIVLSREPRRFGVFFDNAGAERETRGLVEEYGLEVDPSAVVRDISVGLQQRVEILKTLYRGADILILDEPTAVLTPQETDELFDVIRRIVREKQMTVIIITHKLYEVMAISDRVGVMRVRGAWPDLKIPAT
ncbi:MAG: ATP-binding cassette domain-containing protein [Oscillospiraceae bacterium]